MPAGPQDSANFRPFNDAGGYGYELRDDAGHIISKTTLVDTAAQAAAALWGAAGSGPAPVASLETPADSESDQFSADFSIIYSKGVIVEYQVDGVNAPWFPVESPGIPPNMGGTVTLSAVDYGQHSLRLRVTYDGGQMFVGPVSFTRLRPAVTPAADFDGTQDITIPGPFTLQANDWTVDLDVVPRNIAGGTATQVVFSGWTGDLLQQNLHLGWTSAGFPKLGYYGNDLIATTAALVDGTRYTIRYGYDATLDQSYILVNGNEIARSGAGPFIPSGTPSWFVGGRKHLVENANVLVYSIKVQGALVDLSAGTTPVTLPPETTATDTTPGGTLWSTKTISVTSTSTGTPTYRAALDGAALAPVTPTSGVITLTGLTAGTHIYKVASADANGEDPTPASVQFTVTDPGTTGPNLRVASSGTALLINLAATGNQSLLTATSTAPRGQPGRTTTYATVTWTPVTNQPGVFTYSPPASPGSTLSYGVQVGADWVPPDPQPEPTITWAGTPPGGGGTDPVPSGLKLGITGGGISVADSWRTAQAVGARSVRAEFDILSDPASHDATFANYASRGIRIMLMLNWGQTYVLSDAEARRAGLWAARFGIGGTFWSNRTDGQYGVKTIEFGNEVSYSYRWGHTMGGTYANRFKSAQVAVQAANPNVAMLFEMGSEWDDWYTAAFAAVPDLNSRAAGWCVHPYGPPAGRMKTILDRMLSKLQSFGGTAARNKDVWITELGVFTDNGRTMTFGNFYDYSTSLSYSAAGSMLQSQISYLSANYPTVKWMFYYQGNDQRAPGASTGSEYYYGLLKQDLSVKTGFTSVFTSQPNRVAG